MMFSRLETGFCVICYSRHMAIDWTKLYKNYKGFWVTLKDDEVTVISKGKTPQEAFKLAEKKGYSDPYITRVPEEIVSYVG